MQYCPNCKIVFHSLATIGKRCPRCGRKISISDEGNLFGYEQQKYCLECGKPMTKKEIERVKEIALKNFGLIVGTTDSLPCPKCAPVCWRDKGPY